jgi:hypothetical protein
MRGAQKLLKQIKRQAIKVKRPATRSVAGLKAPRPLRRKTLINFK